MTWSEYGNLFNKTDPGLFFDEIFPDMLDGEYTIDGNVWYPCIITKDAEKRGWDGWTSIVTRNQTMTCEPSKLVRKTKIQ